MSGFARSVNRLRKWLFFGAIASATLITVLTTSYSFWKWNRVGQIPDIGDPFDIDDWIPSDLPDNENAAVVYRRAFLLLGNASAPLPNGTPLWDCNRKPQVADEGLFLEVTLPICQLLERAAGMPNTLFYRPENMTIEDPGIGDTSFARDTCRLLQARAEILRANGRLDEAMRDLTSVVAFARHFAVKGNVIQQLTDNAVEATALDDIRNCTGDSRMTAEIAMSTLADLRRMKTPPGASDAIKAEYLYSMKYYLSPETLVGYQEYHEELYGKLGITRDGTVLGPLSRPLPVIGCTSSIEVERAKRLIRLATANLLAVCERPFFKRPPIVEETVKVQSAGMSVFAQDAIDLFDLEGMSGPSRDSWEPSGRQVCQWLATTPWLVEDTVRRASVLASFDRIATRRGVTETFLALKAWKALEGQYPETLELLVGRQLDALPVDPFSGNPFGYVKSTGQVLKHAGPDYTSLQTQPGDLLLYSIGADGVDQNATIECDYGNGRGDWIFLVP